jgi:hypothetical protein
MGEGLIIGGGQALWAASKTDDYFGTRRYLLLGLEPRLPHAHGRRRVLRLLHMQITMQINNAHAETSPHAL